MVKNLFLTIVLILLVLAIFSMVGRPKLYVSSGGGSSTAAPASAPAASTPATAPSASTPAAALAPAPNRIAPGGKAVVAREAQMLLQYGTWRVPPGTEVLILEIKGANAKVRANGQEGTIVLSALQP